MQERNLKGDMVGRLQKALISYLEALSQDRQDSSLTLMACVSLNRHAFMYAAPLVCLSLFHCRFCRSFCLVFFFFPPPVGYFCFLNARLFISLLSVIFLCNFTSPSFPLYVHDVVDSTWTQIQFQCHASPPLWSDVTIVCPPRHSLELPPDVPPLW